MNIAEQIANQLGPCVLLPIPKGTKGPLLKGWQKLTRSDMTPQHLAKLNHGSNIGVLLGQASNGLCTIDCDSDARLAEMLRIDPDLADTLQSKSQRGGNLWIRIRGQFPPSAKISTSEGKPWGEWRASGSQTVFFGTHPSGCAYQNNGKRPLMMEFSEIIWPHDLELPWRKPEPQPAHDPLENCIILPSGKIGLYESADRAFRILAKSQTLFIRGGRVFELASSENGLFKLEVISEQNFRSRIERHGRVVAYRAGPHGEELLKADARCSLDTAAAWLASDAKNLLPPIAAIHNCALITESETKIEVLGKGYHPTCGGRLIMGGETPHRMELSEAVELLLDSVAEYDFATPTDKSRAIACLITPAMRFGGLLRCAHTPLFVVEADDSQAGKGFFLEQVQTTYRETASIVTQRQGGVGGFDESLAQAMIDGRPFIQLDNVRGRIGSPYFEAVLTCPLAGAIPARVPFKGEVQVRPEGFIFQLTSNGFESSRDLTNRSCIVRIRKRRGFSFRRYTEGGLLEHVAANQKRYLGAVFCVVAQWMAHGKQATGDTRGEGRFRQWAQIMDWIVQKLFGLPPLMDGHEAAQERAANPASNWLRQVCLAAEADALLEEPLSASDIMEICQAHSIEPPGVTSDAPDPKLLLRIGQIMGKAFRDRESIECDAFEIRRTETIQYSEERRRDVTLRKYKIGLLRLVAPCALNSHS